MGNQSFVSSFTYAFERENLTTQLHIGHRAIYFIDFVDAATVNILIRIVRKKVANGLDVEVVGKQGGAIRPYSLQVLDVLCQYVQNSLCVVDN